MQEVVVGVFGAFEVDEENVNVDDVVEDFR